MKPDVRRKILHPLMGLDWLFAPTSLPRNSTFPNVFFSSLIYMYVPREGNIPKLAPRCDSQLNAHSPPSLPVNLPQTPFVNC